MAKYSGKYSCYKDIYFSSTFQYRKYSNYQRLVTHRTVDLSGILGEYSKKRCMEFITQINYNPNNENSQNVRRYLKQTERVIEN